MGRQLAGVKYTDPKIKHDRNMLHEYARLKDALNGRDLLSISDLSNSEIKTLLLVASHLKHKHAHRSEEKHLAGESIGLYFEKSSTRTMISFENGIAQLGGFPKYLGNSNLQLGRGETIEDTIGVFSVYYDALVCRLKSHEDLMKIAEIATIPVVNALTDKEHPCQILADLMTIEEQKGVMEGLKLAYFGDAENNVAHSLILAAALMDMEISVAAPEKYFPLPDVVRRAIVLNPNVKLCLTQDPKEAAASADVIYTDTWVSMGDEAQKEQRIKDLGAYQVNAAIMKLAKPDAIFMHDMPAYRGYEVSAEILDGPQSVIFQQAENRMHAQKALLVGLIGK